MQQGYKTGKRITHSHADQTHIPALPLRDRSPRFDQITDKKLAAGPFAAGMLVEIGYWEAFPFGLALLALLILALSLPLHFPADSAEAPAGAMAETKGLLRTPAFWLLFSVAVVYAVCEGLFS